MAYCYSLRTSSSGVLAGPGETGNLGSISGSRRKLYHAIAQFLPNICCLTKQTAYAVPLKNQRHKRTREAPVRRHGVCYTWLHQSVTTGGGMGAMEPLIGS